MSFLVGVVLLAVVTAVACALPGTFMVLRRSSMLVDGISHAVLPGIVLGYFLTRNPDSPWLLLGAALSGLLVVLGSEYLTRTGLIAGDAPQGLVFPALFSVGVILVSLEFSDVHLDTHTVLVGDLNLAGFRQLTVGGLDVGPAALYVMAGVAVLNGAFVWLFYPRLKLATFDPAFARSLGIPTGLLNTALMLLVAVTVTAAFNVAGAILVIALMVVPAASAFLLTKRLSRMIAVTLVIAVGGSFAGFWLAYFLDAPTSAGMAVFQGIVFAAVFVATQSRRTVPVGGAAAAR
ncbi:metal ABC transporter permease [Tessaracoccus rhinocerotis]|uniref:Metal ABC transporter permease n=1 Tax=Tessaracoccus rhinocerotis TaxID=1689449 RepID=A0A553K2B2_9ACTN|nr:metal ABC transporter permease [Tessaracoccus rhinocerotis]TRY18818.1 metal ABC transporter permease [Tessaracoccus rhinocerotis]